MSVLLMLRSAAKDNLHPQRQGHFGAQSHTPRDSCVRFAADVAAGLAQHSPPGGLLSLTCAGLSPADRASFLALPLPALRPLRGAREWPTATLSATNRAALACCRRHCGIRKSCAGNPVPSSTPD